MPLSDYSKDRFIAPEMSRFTSASIKDMTGTSNEQQHWVSNFILNTLLRDSPEDQVRQTLFNILRRTQFAFREYALAREQTMAFLADTERALTYLVAIGHWEVFLSYTYQAFALVARTEKESLFKKNDGSTLQRLNLLYNRSKHLPGAINEKQIAPGSTLAVWLTNAGLHSVDSHLTFEDMAEILESLAQLSDAIQDPLTMHERLAAEHPEPTQ